MKKPFVPTILALMLFAPLPLFAQTSAPRPPGPPPPPGGGPAHLAFVLRALDLTQAQNTAVDSLLRARREVAESEHPAVEAKERALRDQVQAETFDEAAIRAAADAVSDFAADRAVGDAALLRDLRSLLTPAQREKFDRLIVLPPNAMRHDGDEVPS